MGRGWNRRFQRIRGRLCHDDVFNAKDKERQSDRRSEKRKPMNFTQQGLLRYAAVPVVSDAKYGVSFTSGKSEFIALSVHSWR